MKNILKNLSTIFSILFKNKILRKPDFSEKKIFLSGKIMAEINDKKKKIKSLKDVEFSAFSQFGEDGILNWLINKIPDIEKVFVEIGTQDYWESNTRFLLKYKNWKGYLIEGSKEDINRIKSQRIYWQHKIKAIQSFVTKENINELIKNNIKEKKIGLLSIDIDGNDYWIIDEINNLDPVFIVCEYNTLFGDINKFSIPYENSFSREKKHYSSLYFGCSIQALISLLNKKDYCFIGTGSHGVNAFFVKNEFKSFIFDFIDDVEMIPSISRDARSLKGNLTYDNVNKNLEKIIDLEVYDFDSKQIKKIKDYKEIFSNSWKKYFN